MKDNRDPRKLGEALLAVRKMHPDKKLSECADILEEMLKVTATVRPQTFDVNANSNGSNANNNSYH